MYKKSRHIIRLVTLQAALCLLFSISSFADGYSFQEDGDQINQRFSGTNKVYTDGIYVGEMGAIDAYMDNYGNTYNGTNIIDATAYPGAGQDDESTYNGTLSVTANDIISSKTTVDDATVNAATTVTVNEVLSDNNLNAGVQFNNSSFNNDVTLSGSGAVNLSGSTVNNLVLGTIPQMQELLNYQKNISSVVDQLYSIVLLYGEQTTVDTVWAKDVTVSGHTFRVNKYACNRYSFDQITLSVSKSTYYQYLSWYANFANRFEEIQSLLYGYFEYLSYTFYQWFYPLRSASSQYWIAYNTDTGEYDHVNLATVFGYMTWYLGQLYNDGTNITQNMEDMTDNINTAASTFQDMEQKEQAAINQISQGFETFLPDVNQFSSFKAITWCSNYLQQIYLSLGSYGTVIFIALLFGVCLQFIGYFRYK